MQPVVFYRKRPHSDTDSSDDDDDDEYSTDSNEDEETSYKRCVKKHCTDFSSNPYWKGLEPSSCVLVMGDSGRGKTVFIKHIFEEGRLPFVCDRFTCVADKIHVNNDYQEMFDILTRKNPNVIIEPHETIPPNFFKQSQKDKENHVILLDDLDFAVDKKELTHNFAIMNKLANVDATKHGAIIFIILHNPFDKNGLALRAGAHYFVLFKNKNKAAEALFISKHADEEEKTAIYSVLNNKHTSPYSHVVILDARKLEWMDGQFETLVEKE